MSIKLGDIATDGHLIYSGGTAIAEVRAGSDKIYPTDPPPTFVTNIPNMRFKYEDDQHIGWSYNASTHFHNVPPGWTYSIINRPAYIQINSTSGMMTLNRPITDRGEYNIKVALNEPHGGTRQVISNIILLNNRVWGTHFRIQFPAGDGSWSRRHHESNCFILAKLEIWEDNTRMTNFCTADWHSSSAVYGAGYRGQNAFDGNGNTIWHSNCHANDAWIDWSINRSTKITSIQIQARADGKAPARTPDKFMLYVKNKAGTWILIDTCGETNTLYANGTYKTIPIQ